MALAKRIGEWVGGIIVVCIVAVLLLMWLGSRFGLGAWPIVDGSMEPALRPGSLNVTTNVKAEQINVDDIITYPLDGQTLTRRVVEIVAQGDEQRPWFRVKGDGVQTVEPKLVSPRDGNVAKTSFSVPWLGSALDWIQKNNAQGLLVAIPGAILVLIFAFELWASARENRRKRSRVEAVAGTPRPAAATESDAQRAFAAQETTASRWRQDSGVDEEAVAGSVQGAAAPVPLDEGEEPVEAEPEGDFADEAEGVGEVSEWPDEPVAVQEEDQEKEDLVALANGAPLAAAWDAYGAEESSFEMGRDAATEQPAEPVAIEEVAGEPVGVLAQSSEVAYAEPATVRVDDSVVGTVAYTESMPDEETIPAATDVPAVSVGWTSWSSERVTSESEAAIAPADEGAGAQESVSIEPEGAGLGTEEGVQGEIEGESQGSAWAAVEGPAVAEPETRLEVAAAASPPIQLVWAEDVERDLLTPPSFAEAVDVAVEPESESELAPVVGGDVTPEETSVAEETPIAAESVSQGSAWSEEEPAVASETEMETSVASAPLLDEEVEAVEATPIATEPHAEDVSSTEAEPSVAVGPETAWAAVPAPATWEEAPVAEEMPIVAETAPQVSSWGEEEPTAASEVETEAPAASVPMLDEGLAALEAMPVATESELEAWSGVAAAVEGGQERLVWAADVERDLLGAATETTPATESFVPAAMAATGRGIATGTGTFAEAVSSVSIPIRESADSGLPTVLPGAETRQPSEVRPVLGSIGRSGDPTTAPPRESAAPRTTGARAGVGPTYGEGMARPGAMRPVSRTGKKPVLERVGPAAAVVVGVAAVVAALTRGGKRGSSQ